MLHKHLSLGNLIIPVVTCSKPNFNKGDRKKKLQSSIKRSLMINFLCLRKLLTISYQLVLVFILFRTYASVIFFSCRLSRVKRSQSCERVSRLERTRRAFNNPKNLHFWPLTLDCHSTDVRCVSSVYIPNNLHSYLF